MEFLLNLATLTLTVTFVGVHPDDETGALRQKLTWLANMLPAYDAGGPTLTVNFVSDDADALGECGDISVWLHEHCPDALLTRANINIGGECLTRPEWGGRVNCD